MPGRANGHAGTDHRCYILHAWVGLDFGDAALQVLELVRDTGWYGVCAVHVRHHHACDDSDTCQQLRLVANGKMAKLKRSNEKQGQRSGNGQQHNNAELYAECPFCREKKISTRPAAPGHASGAGAGATARPAKRARAGTPPEDDGDYDASEEDDSGSEWSGDD